MHFKNNPKIVFLIKAQHKGIEGNPKAMDETSIMAWLALPTNQSHTQLKYLLLPIIILDNLSHSCQCFHVLIWLIWIDVM